MYIKRIPHRYPLCKCDYLALSAALCPEILPNTTKSATALPPKRLAPCTPPVTSPAAYHPEIASPFSFNTSALGLITIPPIVW